MLESSSAQPIVVGQKPLLTNIENYHRLESCTFPQRASLSWLKGSQTIIINAGSTGLEQKAAEPTKHKLYCWVLTVNIRCFGNNQQDVRKSTLRLCCSVRKNGKESRLKWFWNWPTWLCANPFTKLFQKLSICSSLTSMEKSCMYCCSTQASAG